MESQKKGSLAAGAIRRLTSPLGHKGNDVDAQAVKVARSRTVGTGVYWPEILKS